MFSCLLSDEPKLAATLPGLGSVFQSERNRKGRAEGKKKKKKKFLLANCFETRDFILYVNGQNCHKIIPICKGGWEIKC